MVRNHTSKKMKSGSRPASAPRKSRKSRKSHKPAIPRSLGSLERQCAMHYAETVLNPFDTPQGACVPVPPCLDSAKRKIFARGVGQVMSNGFGGIIATTSMGHDFQSVVYTDGSSATGDSIATTSGVSTGYSNCELDTADFTSKRVQGRVVGCGIRIRYTGKQIDMNGTVYALEEPAHQSTYALTTTDLLGLDKVKPKSFNRQWVVACWQPVTPSETAYSNGVNGHQPWETSAMNQTYPLAILIQCQNMPAGETLPFEWEWFLHYESIGIAARGKSVSHVAPLVGPKVMSALQSAPSSLFDDVSNRLVSAAATSAKMADHGSSWRFVGGLAQRMISTGAAAITSRAASQYMSGGLMALAL